MKFSVLACAVAAVFQALAVLASESASVLLMSNGDVEIENIGSACAAPRTIVELNTNADCRVCCQVYYRDNANPLPTDNEEIAETDRIVNLLLATYLSGECWDLSSDALVRDYQKGEVFYLLTDFPEWLNKVLAALNASSETEKLDLTVVAVSMKAVGEFGQRVLE